MEWTKTPYGCTSWVLDILCTYPVGPVPTISGNYLGPCTLGEGQGTQESPSWVYQGKETGG